MTTRAVFEVRDRGFVATDLASGPWNPNAQHGGAPAALIVRAFERLPASDGLRVARVTYEFMRPVPVGPLEVHAEVEAALPRVVKRPEGPRRRFRPRALG